MKESVQRTPARPRWMWLLLAAGALVILLGLLRGLRHDNPRASAEPTRSEGATLATTFQGADRDAGPARPFTHRLSPEPQPTAQEIVANKVAQFARSRLELVHALARRHNVHVSEDVERFFAAIQSGNWDEIEARFKVINGGDSSAGHAAGRPPGTEHLWPAIIDAYGAAEQAHLLPAQKLLDYEPCGPSPLSNPHNHNGGSKASGPTVPGGSTPYVLSGGARRLRRFTVRLPSALEYSQPGEGSHVEAA